MLTTSIAPMITTDKLSNNIEHAERSHEDYTCQCNFNVMKDRPVSETLHVHEYRVGERYVEAIFDRRYTSSMKASPSHLIFLTALVHTQKMLYMGLCREFGFAYEPEGEERFKMWPTKIQVKIPTLIAEEESLCQKLWIREVRSIAPQKFRVLVESRVDTLQIQCSVPTFVL